MKLWVWLIIGIAIAIAVICALGFFIVYRRQRHLGSRFNNGYPPPLQTMPSPMPPRTAFRLNGGVPPPHNPHRISYQEPAANNEDAIVARPKRHSYQEAPTAYSPQANRQTQTLNRNCELTFVLCSMFMKERYHLRTTPHGVSWLHNSLLQPQSDATPSASSLFHQIA